MWKNEVVSGGFHLRRRCHRRLSFPCEEFGEHVFLDVFLDVRDAVVTVNHLARQQHERGTCHHQDGAGKRHDI